MNPSAAIVLSRHVAKAEQTGEVVPLWRTKVTDNHNFNERVFKPAQIAEKLDLKVGTVWAWCRSGRLPHVRLSARNYRIRESDLEEFLRTATR